MLVVLDVWHAPQTRIGAGCVSVAVALVGLVAASAGGSDGSRSRAVGVSNPLVFTLEYIGTDYEGAVRDGEVVNQVEYGEVLRLTKQVIQEYGARGARSDAIDGGLRELRQLIERRAPAPEVWAATRRVVPLLSKALGGGAGPEKPPNVASGRRLWANDCAPCHGPTGGGDGPAAEGMDPPPTVFRQNRLDWLSPRQVYDATSLGIAGTAMPSFVPAYSEQQRWDVAFFVMTLRVGFEPTRPAEGVRLGLEELAASSNAELLDRLRRGKPEAAPEWVDYFRVNFVSPEGIVPLAGPDAAVSGSMAVAVQMQNAFADVADRVFPHVVGVTSYVPVSDSPSEKTAAGGDGSWMVADAQVNAFPGFRPFRFGSGFLVDDEGYVLSSSWIVKAEGHEVASFVDVELQDQSHLMARTIGAEPSLDLAVLRLADPGKFPKLTAPEFGDSDRLEVGHWLIALGDPPGPDRTFSVGVVSSQPQRQCYQSELSATLVQSSLTVPAGGLGGPVVDIFGHVVGLDVHPGTGDSPSPAASSSARILPINLLLNLYEALKVAESQRSPWIGVSVLELELVRKRVRPEAQAADIPSSGVRIDDVFDPSPASRAGIRPGDFLLAMNGHKLGSVADFQTWMYLLGVDTRVRLEVLRDGKPSQAEVVIESRPASATTR